MAAEDDKPYETLQGVTLVTGDSFTVGYPAPWIEGTTVRKIMRYKRHGNVQVVVALPSGREINHLITTAAISQAFGSDDPDLHEW